MIGFSTLTHFLVKTKKLSPHRSFGSFYKVVWAAVFGNILGKISYQSRCNDKLASDPNSQLGREILAGRGPWILSFAPDSQKEAPTTMMTTPPSVCRPSSADYRKGKRFRRKKGR